jgi:hypothetical protein
MNPASALKGWYWALTILSVVIIESDIVLIAFSVDGGNSNGIVIRESPRTIHTGRIRHYGQYTHIPGRTSNAIGEGIRSLASAGSTLTISRYT